MDTARKYQQSGRMSAKQGTWQQSGSKRLDQKTRLQLGMALRAVYKDFANLELPKRLTDLLKQLEGRI